jgi:hypothetical protein
MSVSSRHVEHFWIFDDVKVEFQGFRVQKRGSLVLRSLVEEIWQLLSIP